MTGSISRREFLTRTAAGAAALAAAPALAAPANAGDRCSRSRWPSGRCTRRFGRGGKEKLDPLKFAEIAKNDYGIDAVEYVNQFYKDKKKDDAYLKDLKKVADDNGVKSVLIMCDGEGDLGDPDEKKRKTGGREPPPVGRVGQVPRLPLDPRERRSRRSRASRSSRSGPPTGCGKLTEFGDTLGINVIVENHGGLSSNGAWLAGVMKTGRPQALRHAAGLRQLPASRARTRSTTATRAWTS